MSTSGRVMGILAVAGLILLSSTVKAQDASAEPASDSKAALSQRVEDLEKLVNQLQGELADVKKQLQTTAAAKPARAMKPAARNSRRFTSGATKATPAATRHCSM